MQVTTQEDMATRKQEDDLLDRFVDAVERAVDFIDQSHDVVQSKLESGLPLHQHGEQHFEQLGNVVNTVLTGLLIVSQLGLQYSGREHFIPFFWAFSMATIFSVASFEFRRTSDSLKLKVVLPETITFLFMLLSMNGMVSSAVSLLGVGASYMVAQPDLSAMIKITPHTTVKATLSHHRDV